MAVVCPYSLTKPGGVQGQALGQVKTLRALGHEAELLAPSDGPPPAAEGVTVLGGSVPLSANGSVAPLALDPASAVRTVRALREQPFDIVHLHEPLCPGPTLAALMFERRPMVGTFHRAGPSTAYAALRPAVVRLARRLALRCAVSNDAKETAATALGGEYEVVFNGVDVERFAGAEPWPTNGPTIFFIGRHERRKGLDVLLDAMDLLPPETRLWLAGDGPETAELRDRSAGDPRVEWLGVIDDDEVASRLRGSDLLCAPSVHGESFGVILLEAMAAGTPVVASDLPGYRNVAPGGDHALLVPPGDSRALAGAVGEVLTEPAVASRLAAAGKERARQFSMGALVERYLELYDVARGAFSRRV